MLLNAHSWFSLNYGILSPEEVLQHAHDLGLQTVALTDINCTAGLSDFFRLADVNKVRPVAGIEFVRGRTRGTSALLGATKGCGS